MSDYATLRARRDELQRRLDRLDGRLQQLLQRLKQQFDCDTIEQARELQIELQRRVRRDGAAFDKALRDFDAEWGDKLRD